MEYKVVVTADAVEDIENIIKYLIVEKKSRQAASAVLNDFEEAIRNLHTMAESFKIVDNPKLKDYGHRRINFKKHKYFAVYRIDGQVAIVDNVFHEQQDYENALK